MELIRTMSGLFNAARKPNAQVRVVSRERQLLQWFALALGMAFVFTAETGFSFAAPAAGTLGYDVYNVVVTKLLSGPIGFVGGVVLIVWGATQVMKQWLTTVMCIIAGTVIIKANTIVTSLGAIAY